MYRATKSFFCKITKIATLLLLAFLATLASNASTSTSQVATAKAAVEASVVSQTNDFFSNGIMDPACRTESRYEIREYTKKGGLYKIHFTYSTKYAFAAPQVNTYNTWRCMDSQGGLKDSQGKMISTYPTPEEGQKAWLECFTANFKNKAYFKDLYFEAYEPFGDSNSTDPTSGAGDMFKGSWSSADCTGDFLYPSTWKCKTPLRMNPPYNFDRPFEPAEYQNVFKGVLTPVGGAENGLLPVCKTGCNFTSHPMSSVIVECVEGTVANMFMKPQEQFILTVKDKDGNLLKDPIYQRTVFQNFQTYIRTTVILLIIAYVAMQGFSTLMGGGLASDGPKGLIMNVIKIAAVSYFAIGDAWKDYFFYALKDLSGGMATIVYNAVAGSSVNADGCFFQAGFYPEGKSILAIFDSIDCKFSNYVGYYPGETFPAIVRFMGMYLLFPIFGQIICMLIVFFTLLLFNLCATLMQMYLGATIYLMIMLFISPLTIPMILFSNETLKGVFSGWLGKIINLSLFQVLTVMLFATIMPVLDTTIYGDNYQNKSLFIEYRPNNNQEVNSLDEKYRAIPKMGPITFTKTVNIDCSDKKGSITCAFRRAQAYTFSIPIPGFIEIFELMFPKVSGGAMLFWMMLNLLKACGMIFLFTNIVDSLRSVVEQLTKAGAASGMINDIKFDNPAKLAAQSAGATGKMAAGAASKGMDKLSGKGKEEDSGARGEGPKSGGDESKKGGDSPPAEAAPTPAIVK
jgi:type IV secretory pathway VirB6-like protein